MDIEAFINKGLCSVTDALQPLSAFVNNTITNHNDLKMQYVQCSLDNLKLNCGWFAVNDSWDDDVKTEKNKTKQKKALMMLLQVMHIYLIIYTCGTIKSIVLHSWNSSACWNRLNSFLGKT